MIIIVLSVEAVIVHWMVFCKATKSMMLIELPININISKFEFEAIHRPRCRCYHPNYSSQQEFLKEGIDYML